MPENTSAKAPPTKIPYSHNNACAQATRLERYADLISIETVHTLNAALCEYHLAHCPPSEELLAACRDANAAYEATARAVRAMDAEMACTDLSPVRGGGGGLG